MLSDKISRIDLDNAREDVAPFIKDDFELEVWSVDFFNSLFEKLS